MIRISQLKIEFQKKYPISKEIIIKKASKQLKIRPEDILEVHIIKESIDARKKPDLFFIYTLDIKLTKNMATKENKVIEKCKSPNITIAKNIEYAFPELEMPVKEDRPIIIGMGPAGLFCGYFLAKAGYQPILLERGADVDTRTRDVEAFWAGEKELSEESNVQFGEGGAGTFSDGKLNTLVKDKDGRNKKVLQTFVEHGADERILYDAKPHIGTDILRNVVKNMREEIKKKGGEVFFHSRVTKLLIENDKIIGVEVNHKEKIKGSQVVLAIGHSARDTFQVLYDQNIPMEAKSFAVGFRVEHSQKMIDVTQYGKENVGYLPAAPYKVTAQATNGRGVYSFCMCPGGYVVNASSEKRRLAVNGMSYSKRDSNNANSAIIVAVTPEDFGSNHPLAGLAFQRELEERAYQAGKGAVPVQFFGDYEENTLAMEAEIKQYEPCIKGAYQYSNLRGILPEKCEEAFIEGMHKFSRFIPDFDNKYAIMSGVESRTSSPVRIHRDDKLQSVEGLYPCGEGAGYAGGITSAAMDGIRIAEQITKHYNIR